jgi:hypothetical protein
MQVAPAYATKGELRSCLRFAVEGEIRTCTNLSDELLELLERVALAGYIDPAEERRAHQIRDDMEAASHLQL